LRRPCRRAASRAEKPDPIRGTFPDCRHFPACGAPG
jgi:hypothetical protein